MGIFRKNIRPKLAAPTDAVTGTRPTQMNIDWRRLVFILLGLTLFVVVNWSPAWPDAVDPNGTHFPLSETGKMALGLFLLAGVWWVFEVVPIGVTSIVIGVIQALFLFHNRQDVAAAFQAAAANPEAMADPASTIRDITGMIRGPAEAFKDFFDPSVWFIFGSIVVGMTFSKVGLTKRMAYKMLTLIGENTTTIYLGVFVMTAALTLIMAHTAVAAAVFPLLMTIHGMYDSSHKPTRFGKGLFIGMAYTAGSGSIITLLGAARGAVAIGFFSEIVGREITFFELTKYMFPIGTVMTLLLWVYMSIYYRPERKSIPGLRDRAREEYDKLGAMTKKEIGVLVIVGTAIVILAARQFVPIFAPLHKSAVILSTTVLFFLFRILSVKDLEDVPWNIILLFGGAMSIGFCLWQTGAAEWLAVNWLTYLKDAPWLIFVLGITFFVLLMTNFIMNVAAIAISMPVALTMAPYLGVAPEVIIFAALVAAGMPFLLLVGAAPNAIAYESGQFKTSEFFVAGIPASILLMIVIGIFVWWIWPVMGMPVLL